MTTQRTTKTAKVADVFSYSRQEHRVTVSRSRAAAAGPDGVQFHAPGWRAMCFRSMDAAVRKMEAHPGFAGWEA